MKRFSTVFIALSFPIFSFSQLAFMPVGAVYISERSCPNGGGPPPTYYSFQVTEDTIIQGKYCTRLSDGAWTDSSNPDDRTYVHQNGHEIYRYDIGSQEFKLVLDFSKQVGESWEVEVDEDYYGNDTLTVTVTEVLGMCREVSVEGGFSSVGSLPICEGFGGLRNSRLLMTPLWFIFTDPACSERVICYQDPVEGVIFGSGQQCTTAAKEEGDEQPGLAIYPNPASDLINCKVPATSPGRATSLRIVDFQGKLVEALPVSQFTAEMFTFPVHDWPSGMYFLQLLEDGAVKSSARFVVIK